MHEESLESIGPMVAGTVVLPTVHARSDAEGTPGDSWYALTLVRDSNTWRLEIQGRVETDVSTVVVETLGELRVVVEEKLGDSAWRSLLQASAYALRVIAPGILAQPSAAERANAS